uniref:Dephospho-CoA kinase n=1 Tax=Candidatus Kentrum sp. LFY TaxID=2126342 RepID=A0A450WCI4_9GAMM|nr:MAG: dephospho-CoA kinase [Candidatus Kentron sp. LFY]
MVNGSRFTVALTGGIASGKSTVARILARQGVAIIDADEVARDVVEPGQPALVEIVSAFGMDILAAGRLDRAALRARVFSAPAERERIEGILHPRIREEMRRRSDTAEGAYCVLAIPLLLEGTRKAPVAGMRNGARGSSGEANSGEVNLACKEAWRVARVLVVDTPVARQVERACKRDGASEAAIRAIIDAQASREGRLAAADDVIVNDGDVERLGRETMDVHYRYLEMARVW